MGQDNPAAALDEAQRTVVQLPATASGVVIGAPGTGKTQALIARVSALVSAGHVSADEVLVLTPTRHTATALRDRLALAVGVATTGPLAKSMASFAYQLVRATSVRRGDEPPVLLTGGDEDRIIADLLAGDDQDAEGGASRWPSSLGAGVRASRSFRTELRALFAECAELGVTAEELAAIGADRARPAWVAAASFLAEYRETLASMRSAHRLPAELLSEAAAVLRRVPRGAVAELGPPAALRTVLVDDAQELTRGGLALLGALRARGVAVLAFGDPDIGSGAFRGASPAIFAELCDLLGEVRVLDEPHRTGTSLTRLSRRVTEAIGAAGRIEHRRAPGPEADDGAIEVVLAPSPFEEVDRIARRLREWHVREGIAWGAMAVIAHDTRQVASLENELAAREVPTRAAGVQRPLGSEQVVRDLGGIVRLGIQHPAERDPELISSALLSPFGGLDAVGLRRLRARLRHAELAADGTRPARELLREAMGDPLSLGRLDTREGTIAERLATTLARIHDAAALGATAHELLWEAWYSARDATGRRLADAWRELAVGGGLLASETDAALDALVALFDAAKRHAERSPDERPGEFLRGLLDSDVPEDILTAPERPDTVVLLTPAAALGTEFDAVVIAGVQDGVWPNVRPRGGLLDAWRLPDEVLAHRMGTPPPDEPAVRERRREALHDELRLLVRALSRARTRLLVTAVDDDDSGPSPLLTFFPEPDRDPDAPTVPQHPLTLRGLVAQHRRALTATSSPQVREHAAGQLVLLADAGVAGADPASWYGVSEPSSTSPLRDPALGPVPVSPSRLDGFAACPLDWAVRALGGDTRSWSAGVGTILHAALEEVPDGDIAALQAVVDGRWGELEFEAPWMAEKERAWGELLVQRLSAYLTRFRREGGRAIGAELRFRLAIDMDASPPELIHGEDAVARAVADGRRVAQLSGSVDRVEAYPNGKGEGVPGHPERDGGERVMIVDLKTGRSEKKVSDQKVVDDPQLAAYQLAFLAGAVSGTEAFEAETDNAGARLLVLSQTLKGTHYRLARQEAMSSERRTRFLGQIVEAATGMASHTFDAHLDTHCTTDRFGVCLVHTVKAVSAS